MAEQDTSCRRNAFMMLAHVDQARALDYLVGVLDQLNSFGDILQLVIVELIYKVRLRLRVSDSGNTAQRPAATRWPGMRVAGPPWGAAGEAWRHGKGQLNRRICCRFADRMRCSERAS